MTGLLGRLFGRKAAADEPPLRLTAEEAARIAAQAANGQPFADRLVLRGTWPEHGRPSWHFWSATIGSGLLVRVDDATGEAMVEQVSGR